MVSRPHGRGPRADLMGPAPLSLCLARCVPAARALRALLCVVWCVVVCGVLCACIALCMRALPAVVPCPRVLLDLCCYCAFPSDGRVDKVPDRQRGGTERERISLTSAGLKLGSQVLGAETGASAQRKQIGISNHHRPTHTHWGYDIRRTGQEKGHSSSEADTRTDKRSEGHQFKGACYIVKTCST